MRLHTAITDKLGALDAPGCSNRIVTAAATFDHVLGRLHTARVLVHGVFAQEHIIDNELHPGFHLAHRTEQHRCVVGQVGELLLHARIARHVQTLEQLRFVRRGQDLLAPDALGLDWCVIGGGFRGVPLIFCAIARVGRAFVGALKQLLLDVLRKQGQKIVHRIYQIIGFHVGSRWDRRSLSRHLSETEVTIQLTVIQV